MSHSNIFSLDLETASLDKSNPQFALEPFRLSQGKAEVTSLAVVGPNGFARNITAISKEELTDLLYFLRDSKRPVFCHNTIFDTAWMLLLSGNFELMASIDWHDTGLLAKWIVNSQATDKGGLSFSLKSLCGYFMPEHERLGEFEEMKDEDVVAGENEEYWFKRGIFDAEMTRDLAMTALGHLPESQYNGYHIEQKCLIYAARAWVNGIPLRKDYIESLPPKIRGAMKKIESQMPIDRTVVKSPAQLSKYLFDTLGLTPLNYGKPNKKTGKANGSTAAGDLKRLRIMHGNSDVGKLLGNILDLKQLSTLETKYMNGFDRAMNYTGQPVIYTSPRLFGTYTGRFTYSSKTLKKEAFQTSIATHQLPRKGPTKKCLGVPEGKWLIKCDGSQQELRIIGIVSPDDGLIHEFNTGLDVHSTMSAFIANMSYEEFMKLLSEGVAEIINYRYAGKLLNLSCQYRIGAQALMDKFFETYGIIITRNEAFYYLNLYKSRYPGVVAYWEQTAQQAREIGYARTFADRRFYIDRWQDMKWQSESSSINFPIQGGAADHKELTLLLMSEKYPEAEFFLDIHDEVCFFVPQDIELVRAFAEDIANLSNKYREVWGIDLSIDLPFDTVLCDENFKEGTVINAG